MKGPRFRRDALPAVLIGIASVLLLSTFAMSWYSTSIVTGKEVVAGESFYLTGVRLAGNNGTAQYANWSSYSATWLPETGAMYLVVGGLVATAALMGILTTILLLKGAGRTHRKLLSWVAIVAVLLAAGGPVFVALAQPSIVCADAHYLPSIPGGPIGGGSDQAPGCGWAIQVFANPDGAMELYTGQSAGPQSSFYGSEAGFLGTGESHNWGPSLGWYVALAGFALLWAGCLLYAISRPPSAAATGDSEVGPSSPSATRAVNNKPALPE
jgi:MFS family permease